jgi:hypothetical protein
MAAYTKQDVLDALLDATLHRITIIFDSMVINVAGFLLVRNQIDSGNIQVVQGSSSANAYYNTSDDTLTTQDGPSPAPYWKKSLLIHECVHALFDIYKYTTTGLTNELLCYITQVAYEIMSDSRYKYSLDPSLTAGSNDAKWNQFWVDIETYVRGLGYSFGTTGGIVMVKNDAAFQALRTQINGLNIYQHLSSTTNYSADGICHRNYNLVNGVSVRLQTTCP